MNFLPNTVLTAESLNAAFTEKADAAATTAALAEKADAAATTAALAEKADAAATTAALAEKIQSAEKGAANGVATLGADAKIPESQLPAIAITDTFVVANEAAMLALSAQRGDIAVRADINKTFALATEPASVLANWIELRTPTDEVLSVAGKTGAVSLVKGDVGLANVDNTSDTNKPVSAAQQAAIDLKHPLMQAATQAEMEAGTESALRAMSPSRVKQAIDALGGSVNKYLGGGTLSGKLNAVFDTAAYSIPDLTTLAASYTLLFPSNATPQTTFNLTDGWTLGLTASANQIHTPYPVSCKHGIWPGGTYTPQVDATYTATTSSIVSAVALSADLHILLLSNDTVVAFNSSTNTFGTAVSSSVIGGEQKLHIVSSTSFVVSGSLSSERADPGAQAFSVSGTTITAGTAVSMGNTSTAQQARQPVVQLSATSFVIFYGRSTSFDVAAKAFTVSGTTITAGTESVIGSYAESNAANAGLIVAAGVVSSTSLLVSYLTTGGGSTTTRAFASRVLSVSGTTITLRTAATSGGNINGEVINAFVAFSGTSFAVAVDSGTNGSVNWFGIAVSGTTTTVGAVQTLTKPGFGTSVVTYSPSIVTGASQAILYCYDNIGARDSSVVGLTISGTTLTVGAPIAIDTTSDNLIVDPFIRDAETNSIIFVRKPNTSQIAKLSISGATVSIDYLLPEARWVYSETLNAGSVNIGGTWYSRTVTDLVAETPYRISPTRAIVRRSGVGLVVLSNLSTF